MRLFWWFSTNVQAWDIFKLASPWVVHQITQLQYSKTTWNMLPFPAASNRSNVSAVKPKPAKIIRENLIRILTAWTRIERHATKFFTVFESRQKSRIQYCERSELRLHFKYQKFIESAKNGQFGNFLKNWSYLKTVLPDRPISKGQKLVKRAKIEKLTMRHFGRFSTIVHCIGHWPVYLLGVWSDTNRS